MHLLCYFFQLQVHATHLNLAASKYLCKGITQDSSSTALTDQIGQLTTQLSYHRKEFISLKLLQGGSTAMPAGATLSALAAYCSISALLIGETVTAQGLT